VNGTTVVGASGEYSDFQAIMKLLEDLSTEDFCNDDAVHMGPQQVRL
jgi:20S proteasome subunit beta 7